MTILMKDHSIRTEWSVVTNCPFHVINGKLLLLGEWVHTHMEVSLAELRTSAMSNVLTDWGIIIYG